MHHLNAIADVFETNCGSLKLLLDNGQGPTLDALARSLSAVSEAPISRRTVESRCLGGRLRYSDLKEAAPEDYGLGVVAAP